MAIPTRNRLVASTASAATWSSQDFNAEEYMRSCI